MHTYKKTVTLVAIVTLTLSAFFGPAAYAQEETVFGGSPVIGGGSDAGVTGAPAVGGGSGTGLTGTQPTGGGSGARMTGSNPIGAGLGKPTLSIPGIVGWFVALLNYIVVALLVAALVTFLYGILRLSFFDGANPESIAKSRKFMMWGIVSLFVMVSVWGLVNILTASIFGGGLIIPKLR